MGKPSSKSGYHIVPTDVEESYHDSPEAPLLQQESPLERLGRSTPRSLTFNFGIIFRALCLLLAFISLLLLAIDGNPAFIAADIFLAVLIIFNASVIIHRSISHIFRITIEVRQRPWKQNLNGKLRVRRLVFLDIGLSIITFICCLAGHLASVNRRWWGFWEAGVIMGYVVIGVQTIAVPLFDRMKLTLAVSFDSGYGARPTVGIQAPLQEAADDRDAALIGADTTDGETPRVSCDTLV